MPSTRLILWDTHGIRVTFGYRNVTYAIQETKRFLVVRTAVFFTKTLRVVVLSVATNHVGTVRLTVCRFGSVPDTWYFPEP